MKTNSNTTIQRAPVVAIMGHIDHGKSTLLSYIRKSSEPLNEAGGITQHISAYEVEHTGQDNKKHLITFIDTPGHEAFCGIRKRGASVADIAVLVVSAEDGVKTQTKEALSSIIESKTPYIVAINKIDKPGADINRTKQSLSENEIYIEGFGGDIPCVALSAKTGEGVSELLDMIILVAEIEDLKAEPNIPAEGIVIESNRDIKKGISATCIIKNGSLKKGMYITSGVATAPVRMMENYVGKQIDSATFSSPVKIIGWDELPSVGETFHTFQTRDEAKENISSEKDLRVSSFGNKSTPTNEPVSLNIVPLIVKADTGSSLEALLSEIKKLKTEKVDPQVVASGIGTISEKDVKNADGNQKAIVIGFNTKIDSPAKNLAERNEIEIHTFDIIYKMSEWLKETLVSRTPKVSVEESVGEAKILKIFSKVKDKQILGGRVEKGLISTGSQVKIMRRDIEIGTGRIRELQQQKMKSSEAKEGTEFGSMIESKTEISSGDRIISFVVTEK
ncbi:MAG: translation initiation factor IF-2 [Parcubacteria group bacterium]